jgi:hypothetical protein
LYPFLSTSAEFFGSFDRKVVKKFAGDLNILQNQQSSSTSGLQIRVPNLGGKIRNIFERKKMEKLVLTRAASKSVKCQREEEKK